MQVLQTRFDQLRGQLVNCDLKDFVFDADTDWSAHSAQVGSGQVHLWHVAQAKPSSWSVVHTTLCCIWAMRTAVCQVLACLTVLMPNQPVCLCCKVTANYSRQRLNRDLMGALRVSACWLANAGSGPSGASKPACRQPGSHDRRCSHRSRYCCWT